MPHHLMTLSNHVLQQDPDGAGETEDVDSGQAEDMGQIETEGPADYTAACYPKKGHRPVRGKTTCSHSNHSCPLLSTSMNPGVSVSLSKPISQGRGGMSSAI